MHSTVQRPQPTTASGECKCLESNSRRLPNADHVIWKCWGGNTKLSYVWRQATADAGNNLCRHVKMFTVQHFKPARFPSSHKIGIHTSIQKYPDLVGKPLNSQYCGELILLRRSRGKHAEWSRWEITNKLGGELTAVRGLLKFVSSFLHTILW